LATRFTERLLSAWPEGQLDRSVVEREVEIRAVELHGTRALMVAFGGRSISVEWDGSMGDATAIVDDAAESVAWDSEGDRWTSGEGWREHRP
jgi:hypothetical protein